MVDHPLSYTAEVARTMRQQNQTICVESVTRCHSTPTSAARSARRPSANEDAVLACSRDGGGEGGQPELKPPPPPLVLQQVPLERE